MRLSGLAPSIVALTAIVAASAAVLTWQIGSALAQEAPPPSAMSERTPTTECPPAPGPITIDGDLREWTLGRAIEIGPDQLVKRNAAYGGPADLSGKILVCRSATTLYVAGEIHDDVLFWNPDTSWRGDGVELFFDFRSDATARSTDAYDQDTYQLLLHSLASEVRWNFAWYRGRPGRMDDPMDGIELAGLRFQDDRGATVGYRFEVAIPLANFPGVPREKGRAFGFDVALSDSDGLPEQRNYATWSGRSDLSRFPSRFGQLVLGDNPPKAVAPESAGGSQLLPIAFVAVVLGLVLSIWLARGLDARASRIGGWLARVSDIPTRRKLVAAATLVALLIAAGPTASLVARGLASRELANRREVGALVRDVAAEALPLGLQRPQLPVHPSPLLSILTGQAVKLPTEFEFTVLPPMAVGDDGTAAPEPTSRTLAGVPFLRRDIPATAAWSGSFLVHPPCAAESATLVTSWRADIGSDVPPKPGEVVAEVRFAHLDGTVDPPVELVWGRHVDASDDVTALTGHTGAPESAVAWISGSSPSERVAADGVEHADELTVPLAATDSPVVRIEVEQRAPGGRFTTHGITLHTKGGTETVPLPLGRATRGGVPTAAAPFPSPDAGLIVSRATPHVVVPCDVTADRLWLVVSLRRGFSPNRTGLPVMLVRAEFEDGSVDGPFPLENGTDIDLETSLPRLHGDAFRSELAFEWGLPDAPRGHADLWSARFARPGRRLTKLHFEFKGEDEVVRVSSIVLGSPGRAPRTDGLLHLESTADGFRLSAGDRERLTGLEFTSFRDGAAYATTLGGADRERALARAATPDVAGAIARSPEGVHDVRLLDGRRIHALSIPLPGARTGSFIEITWVGDAGDELAVIVFRVRTVLGVLLVPILVLLAAGAIRRLRTVHARLVAVCAAVSAVPAVLGFFTIPELVVGRIEESERDAVLQKAAAAKTRLVSLRVEALRRAETAIQDPALGEALKRRGLPDFRASVVPALVDLERNLTTETMPGARIAFDVLPLTSDGERFVYPRDVEYTVFRDRATQVADALAYRWSRLTARGVAQRFDTEGRWQTTLVVDLPVDRAAVDAAATAAGGDVQVHLYTPRGFPLAETAARVPGEELPEETERKVGIALRVLREQQPFVEARSLGGTLYTVAYDVLRGESGDVSLVATALPRSGADALLARVGQTSLLIFGAGVAVQFLLIGLVAVGTTRPLGRVIARATEGRSSDGVGGFGGDGSSGDGGGLSDEPGGPDGGPRSPDGAPGDEIASLSAAVAGLQHERDVYRDEIARISAAVAELAKAREPEAVVATAIEIVRKSLAPWGAAIVTVDDEGRHEVAGGFRGDDRIARMPIVVDVNSPLVPVLRGRSDARVAPLGAAADSLSRDERQLFDGAASFEAFPLSGEEERGGALVLIERAGPAVRRRTFHDEFPGAIARQVGLALGAARLVRLAVRDPETGSHVASYFAERLREEVDRAVAAKRPIALLLVSASDPPNAAPEVRAAAQRIADRVRAEAPQRAFLGRLETLLFAIAIPESDRASADALTATLRRAAAEPGLAGVRLRIGFAACPEDAGSSEFLLAEARRRLGGEPGSAASRPATAVGTDERLAADARKHGVVFASPEGRALLETVHRIAASDLTLLVEGETGTGKEIVADLVHRWSPRRDRAIVKVNCAALPDALLESELFGYERGAFTGADKSKPGRFELADGGTLVLDEIGEMPLNVQAKILRVLEDRTVEHLGGTRPVPVNVRIIASTNRDLGRMVSEGRFREDLFYRLNAVTISVPPLRARKEDIPPLAESFLLAAAEAHGRRAPTLQPDAMDLLFRHSWPGNVRELRNLMEQVVVLQTSDSVRAADLIPSLGKGARPRVGGAAAVSAASAGASAPWSGRDADHESARDAARDAGRDVGRDSAGSAAAGAPASPPPPTPSGAAPEAPWSPSSADVYADSPAAVSDRQRRLLALMAERTWITTSEYCDIVGVSPRTALRDVRELVERGVIVMDGKRRGARYRLP
ncbi:MAG: sigma 54-interacting transcriptional regulator [Planctomycetes bacterium]|nr:sigma 54-interacting transcriptional regulator [Planctomycetota bacterium]